jgi:hypothetical protein
MKTKHVREGSWTREALDLEFVLCAWGPLVVVEVGETGLLY